MKLPLLTPRLDRPILRFDDFSLGRAIKYRRIDRDVLGQCEPRDDTEQAYSVSRALCGQTKLYQLHWRSYIVELHR